MKLRTIPEDFIVEEIPRIFRDQKGQYAIYKLTKRNIDTFGALRILADRLRIDRKEIGSAGLKDKHAITAQYVSIKTNKNEKWNIREKNLTLAYFCRAKYPVKPGALMGNKFVIAIRDLTGEETSRIAQNYPYLDSYGWPNYFGDQRFGTYASTQGFIARELLKNNHEKALKIFLTYTVPTESARSKECKKFIADNWGRWDACAKFIKKEKEHYVELWKAVHQLQQRPQDFRSALLKISDELRNMMVGAYQSYLWNEYLKELLVSLLPKKSMLEAHYLCGTLLFYTKLEKNALQKLMKMELSLLDRNKMLQKTFAKEGISGAADFEKLFWFTPLRMITKRRAIVLPESFKIMGIEDDEYFQKKKKLVFTFTLPKGAYATVGVERMGM